MNNPKSEPNNYEAIPIEPVSSLTRHIDSIMHFPQRNRIELRMNPETRCPNPSLVGRLSGRSLSMIQWDTTPPHHMRGDTSLPIIVGGSYNVPYNGKYFIEILILYCRQINDYNIWDNLSEKCIENPNYFRLTASEAHIQVTSANDKSAPVPPPPGYWTSTTMTPLSTRWQPQKCRHPHTREERCAKHITTAPFQQYNFHWDRAHASAAREVPVLQNVISGDVDDYTHNCVNERGICRVCTVGASHSRRLYRYLEAIQVQHVGYFAFKYPDEIDTSTAAEIKKACPGAILIGFGQWSLTYNRKTPPLKYRDEMRNLLRLFKGHRGGVYVRNVHYSPLGDIQTHCPVWDFRSPPIVERYNALVKEVCEEMDVGFLDTEFITRPMWDSAEDWNHPNENVQIVEAQYIAGLLDLL